MVSASEVQAQLKKLKVRPGFLANKEAAELPRVLVPGEKLSQVVVGWYQGGFALLCCTDRRVLLIDKKPFFLTIEDVRYDMIAEVMYQYRLLDSTLTLAYNIKPLSFKSWNQGKLRQLANYIQQRVMEVRKYQQVGDEANESTPKPTFIPQATATQQFAGGTVNFAASSSANTQRGSTGSFEKPIEAMASDLPRKPYSIKRPLNRRKISKFIMSTQLARN